MANELRMVKFYEKRPEGFTPDLEQNGLSNQDENHCEKDGYFHCWVNEERKSAQSGLFREETVALVEDLNSGKMYHIDYDLLRFVLV